MEVKKALVEALGSEKLDVLLVMCSSLEADFVHLQMTAGTAGNSGIPPTPPEPQIGDFSE